MSDDLGQTEAGQITLGMVSLSILGGLGAGLAVCDSTEFQQAAASSPLFLAWATLVAANGILAWSMLLPGIWAVQNLWPKVSAYARRQILFSLLIIVLILVGYFAIVPRQFPLDVKWPLGPSHSTRTTILSVIVLL